MPTGFIAKHEVKERTEKPRRRWVENIKAYLKEVGQKGVHWIYLVLETRGWLL